jgi:hypothetical protein
MGQAMKEFQKAKADFSHELRTPGNAHTQADNSGSGSDAPTPIGTGIEIAQATELRRETGRGMKPTSSLIE